MKTKYDRIDDNELHRLIIEYNKTADEQTACQIYALCARLADAILFSFVLQDKEYVKQDAIVKVFDNLHKYNGNVKQCVNYVYTIIRRYALDQVRRQNTRQKHTYLAGNSYTLDIVTNMRK